MALYLGNQKVSLRSGQDPTFDYGFDSNGRLVFANKNATEINNFLNYDSTYSEILDLSNLSKMEKVAVNGTAYRKMEGLKGLLVSPNAPFTGSSPQINASYTGLSKRALVSLFESVPYNVGYEKVGSPTIKDGVASGFSASDYLQIQNYDTVFNNSSTFEIITKFKMSSMGDWKIINKMWNTPTRYQGGLSTQNGKVKWYIYNDSVSTSMACDTTLSKDVWYYAKQTKINNVYSVSWSNDGVTWYDTKEVELADAGFYSIFLYGNNQNYGNENLSIDLNETYIKVNGVPWFTGKPAMTKTCSIVGTTGTADLTQEDKNIILNKGWSLTVQ